VTKWGDRGSSPPLSLSSKIIKKYKCTLQRKVVIISQNNATTAYLEG
jgi:hypothetical protein